MPEPDFIKLRDAKIAALSKMGIPDVLVRAMYRPNTVLEDWSIEGVSGKCPTGTRVGWQLEIVKDKLYVYGGWVGEGKNRTYLRRRLPASTCRPRRGRRSSAATSTTSWPPAGGT